jgi:hypothetical protein
MKWVMASTALNLFAADALSDLERRQSATRWRLAPAAAIERRSVGRITRKRIE